MQCYKEDIEEPMELGDSNYPSKKSYQKEESKSSYNSEILIQEALSFAETLNDRLKSLNEDDAEIFMKAYERNVILLPKKKDIKANQHEQLITQTSNELTQDYVMINSDVNKTAENSPNILLSEKEKALFGTSSKPPTNYSMQKQYTPMVADIECGEQKLNKMNKAQGGVYFSSGKEFLGEFVGSQNEPLNQPNRSISVERKTYSSSNPCQEKSYCDAVQGKKTEYSTTFPALISPNEMKNSWTPKENKLPTVDENKRKPRSASTHSSSRNMNVSTIEKTDYNFLQHNQQQTTSKTLNSQISRQLALEAVPTQVANVTQQNSDWLGGSSRPLSSNTNGKKSLNMLVLGQTGVGKSTWINAFVNYLTYSTLEEAIAAKAPACIIPTKFSMFDENYQRHEVLLGNHSNEVFSDKGQSATQNAKTYLFENENFNIYIIDTPGMDDTRGPKQDNENVRKILRAIAPFKEVHAICFLFKANEARLTQSFKYCISKLLSNLSKSALNNACFVFTNARGTFYKPGDTMGPLKTYFQELRQKEHLSVTINDANTFCLDNEAFRFICAYFSNIKFGDHEIETYANSWKHSSKEVTRLLSHASRLKAHNTSETLSINETRTWILQLVTPIINVSGIIQTNLYKLEEQIHDLEVTNDNIQDLQKRVAIPITSLETIQLKDPQTVCTSEKCISYETIEGNTQRIYKTVCHKPCYLAVSDTSLIYDPNLKECAAFDRSTGKCYTCECNVKQHIRIFYEQRIVTKPLQTLALKSLLSSEVDEKKFKKRMIRNCEKMIDGYMGELDYVLHGMANFSAFLSQNGISQKADIFEKHLENLIENEERMLRNVRHCDEKKYYRLINLLNSYKEIRDKLHHIQKAISLSEIQDIRQKLFAMPLTGSKIAEVFDIHVENDKNDFAVNITRCDKKSIFKQVFDWSKNKICEIFGGHMNS